VYKARRIGPVITAVKILPTPIHAESENDKNYSNFLNEVQKLKKVNEIPNPNVVKILSSGITESGSLPYIEMEFIEGPDLEELLKPPHTQIFTIKEVIKLAEQLAGALSHCHKVGVKHGDIKSNNVKFSIHSGNYVLLDFGLSVMSDEQRRSSLRHAGAIEFMAPEQNEGKMLFQTDIYSYGVVLYELLAGQVPFPLKDNRETARNSVMISHMEAKVPNLLTLRRQHLPESWPEARQEREMQIPGWLLNMVLICLEKSPENRYANGMELQEAIVVNSLIADRHEQAENVISALKTENEKLQMQLLKFQYDAKNIKRSSVTIPKSTLVGVALLLIAALCFGGYTFWPKKRAVYLPVKDTTSYSAQPVNGLPDNNAANNDGSQVINPPDNTTVKKPVTTAKKKKHKKKRRKFWGLF